MLFYTLHRLLRTSYMISQTYLTLLGILQRKTNSMTVLLLAWLKL